MSSEKGYVKDGLGNFILPKTFSNCIYDEDTNERLDNTLEEMQESINAKVETSHIANNDTVTEEGFVWDARRGKQARQDIGTMANLETTEKGSLVGAVNEVTNNLNAVSPANYIINTADGKACMISTADAGVFRFFTGNKADKNYTELQFTATGIIAYKYVNDVLTSAKTITTF